MWQNKNSTLYIINVHYFYEVQSIYHYLLNVGLFAAGFFSTTTGSGVAFFGDPPPNRENVGLFVAGFFSTTGAGADFCALLAAASAAAAFLFCANSVSYQKSICISWMWMQSTKYYQNIHHKYNLPSRFAAAIALASSACALRLAAASWRFASAMAFASFWKIRVSRLIMERDMIVTYVSIWGLQIQKGT